MADNFNICKSQMKASEETFIWMIDNFSDRHQTARESIESGNFTSTFPCGKLEWCLNLYPKVSSFGRESEVAISIALLNPAPFKVLAKIKFMFRDFEGVDILKGVIGNSDFTKRPSARIDINRAELLSKKHLYLPEDRLTIVCQVTVFEEIMEMKKSSIDDLKVPECRALEDIGNLFDKGGQFSDCTLVASDGREFKVHKNILACRSPVFAAMFEHEMLEAKEGIVKIGDIESGVLEQLIRFIYTGTAPKVEEVTEELLKVANSNHQFSDREWTQLEDLNEKVPKLGENAKELLEAADKYQLDRLKLLCERQLALSLEVENACELFAFANLNMAKRLKARAIKFIQMHANEVMKSKGWKMLINGNDAELIGELMMYLAAGK